MKNLFLILTLIFSVACTEEQQKQADTFKDEVREPSNELVVNDVCAAATQNVKVNDHASDFRDNSFYWEVEKGADYDITNFITTETRDFGDTNYYAIKLEEETNIVCLEVYDTYTKKYSMGELEVLVSTNSTDGIDGDWETVSSYNDQSIIYENEASYVAVNKKALWIKLFMTYKGRGGHGDSPAFYLSEIIPYK